MSNSKGSYNQRMTEEDFRSIDWPDEVLVCWTDGSQERLLFVEGLSYESPQDCPYGRGGISAMIPLKHSKHQDRALRHCYLDELLAVKSVDGRVIW